MNKVYIIAIKDRFNVGDPEFSIAASSLEAAIEYLKSNGYEDLGNREYEKYDEARDTKLYAWITGMDLIN